MSVDLRPFFPAALVAITGLVVLLAQAFVPRGGKAPAGSLSLLGLASSLVSVFLLWGQPGAPSTPGSLVADRYALFLQALLVLVGIVVVLLSGSYAKSIQVDRGEYYALVLFSIVGMMGLVSATELISLFVALEIMSVSLYALAGLRRDRPESQEAAAKYFLTGAFSSAFLLYGIALVYGTTGTTSLARIGTALSAPQHSGLAILATAFLLVGFGFKVASVPSHMWTPDVYEGAPTTITAFMAAGVKAAAFGALARVLGTALVGLGGQWRSSVAVLAVLTVVFGNLGALAQTSVKRMLAYSSVAHAGYLLMALVAPPAVAAGAILFYLAGYAPVNLASFGILASLARDGREPASLQDLSGLAERRPALAGLFTLCLISLGGVPVSAGFVGKFYLFAAAVNAGYTSLAVVGVLMSVVSAYYYLRVVVAMYMRPTSDESWSRVSPASALALASCGIAVLGLGLFPTPVLEWALMAGRSLR